MGQISVAFPAAKEADNEHTADGKVNSTPTDDDGNSTPTDGEGNGTPSEDTGAETDNVDNSVDNSSEAGEGNQPEEPATPKKKKMSTQE